MQSPFMTSYQKRLVNSYVYSVLNTENGTGQRFVLFFGPSGCGKTYILNRVEDSLRQFQNVKVIKLDKCVKTLNDICADVLKKLNIKHDNDEYIELKFRYELLELKNNGKIIVILIENMGEIFEMIRTNDEHGLARLRSIIQMEQSFSIFGTAPDLFHDIICYDEPFYRFFETVNMHPFTKNESIDFITHKLKLAGKHDLLKNIDNKTILNIHHMTSGIPLKLEKMTNDIIKTNSFSINNDA